MHVRTVLYTHSRDLYRLAIFPPDSTVVLLDPTPGRLRTSIPRDGGREIPTGNPGVGHGQVADSYILALEAGNTTSTGTTVPGVVYQC